MALGGDGQVRLAADRLLLSGAAPGRPVGSARGPAPVRLTRRGRIVLVAVMVGALVGSFGWSAAASDHTPRQARTTVVVQPGDSLWSIAVRERPDSDPFQVVEDFRRVNRLDGYVVHPGQRLIVPG